MLEYDKVAAFCRSREVDLRLVRPRAGYSIELCAECDGYGHFFSICVADVEYVELPGQFTVGRLSLSRDSAKLVGLPDKWREITRRYSGTSLLLWGADAIDVIDGSAEDRFLIVAASIVFFSGADWSEPASAPP